MNGSRQGEYAMRWPISTSTVATTIEPIGLGRPWFWGGEQNLLVPNGGWLYSLPPFVKRLGGSRTDRFALWFVHLIQSILQGSSRGDSTNWVSSRGSEASTVRLLRSLTRPLFTFSRRSQVNTSTGSWNTLQCGFPPGSPLPSRHNASLVSISPTYDYIPHTELTTPRYRPCRRPPRPRCQHLHLGLV